MAKLTADIAAIDAQLADGLFARDPAKATALSKARAEAADALAQAEEDWLTASADYEEADGLAARRRRARFLHRPVERARRLTAR